VKRVLAERFSRDREAYVEAKSPHVQEILRRAAGVPSAPWPGARRPLQSAS
jgi:hypothetical protein